MQLLGQAESHLDAETGGGSGIRVCYEGFVDRALEIPLHSQLLVYDVADVRPQLEINVSIRYRAEIIDLALDRLIIADRDIHAECNIILQHNCTSL